jgi:tetratricopeptide (TPR) repeat protein
MPYNKIKDQRNMSSKPRPQNSKLRARNFLPGTLLTVLFTLLLIFNCTNPPPAIETWQQAISHKNLGLAYLDRNDFDNAIKEFETVIKLLPDEPLGYADLAVTYLKLQTPDGATDYIAEAIDRASEDGEILSIQADVSAARGNQGQALKILKAAVLLNPENAYLRYKYLTTLRRIEGPAHLPDDTIVQLQAILQYDPDNLAVLSELGETLIRTGQLEQATISYESISQFLSPVPESIQPYLQATMTATQQQNNADAGKNASILGNLLKIDPAYRASRDVLGDPSQQSPPLRDFRTAPLDLAQTSASPLIDLEFVDATDQIMNLLSSSTLPIQDMALADLNGNGRLDLALATKNGLVVLQNMEQGWQNITDHIGLDHVDQPMRLLFSDIDNDGDLDLYALGRKQNWLAQNDGDGTFSPIQSLALTGGQSPAAGLFADYDHDGDLDILTSDLDNVQFYRNINDGRFEEATEAAGFTQNQTIGRDYWPRQPVGYGDFDLDGALDIVALSTRGQHHLYRNIRQGRWVDWTERMNLPNVAGVQVTLTGDFNNDGTMDLFWAGKTPVALKMLWNERGRLFADDIPRTVKTAGADLNTNVARAFDFDNDGFLDITIGGQSESDRPGLRLIRNLGNGRFEETTHLFPEIPSAIEDMETGDLDLDGDLDIIVLSADGLHLLRNDGGHVNGWFDLQLAAALQGSSKNNFYGIGSTIDINTETHYQSLQVTTPITHIGLGSHDKADVLRVIWSNGVPQNRINPEPFTRVTEQQRLKGSCPSLYTWNGERYVFVTHLMTRSAIGALAETGTPAYPDAAADHVKIRGDQMQPQDGKFVINVVEELWDAVYLDEMHLLAVDHPRESDIYVDEKYVPPPYPDLHIYTATDPRLPIRASDHHGHDILPQLTARDSLYAGDYGLGIYQGVPEEHAITLDLGDLKGAKKIQLYLCGWIMPIEPSSNLALSQQQNAQVIAPYLEVPDAQGQWQTAIPYTGFPSGEHKTMVIDLTDQFLADDYRIRITTNLQLYWSEAFFTVDEPDEIPMKLTRLAPIAADLHYRGFSREYQVSANGPYLRDYDVLSTAAQWLPFEGYRTKYGDITPLLQEADDQYAIYSSGEEVTVTFDAASLPTLPEGWTRDYILYSDGWLKEGDLNTNTAATIEPLPFHGMPTYPYPPATRFPDREIHVGYMNIYNTRWVSQKKFREEIRFFGDALQVVDRE